MWVQFTSPQWLDQWIHGILVKFCSLHQWIHSKLMKSLVNVRTFISNLGPANKPKMLKVGPKVFRPWLPEWSEP
jgi:hypothetical protein